MGVETGIAWTDHTFNPWWGCQRVSPGCEHCYAEAWDKRVGGKHWGPTSERRLFGEKHWNEPRTWNRAARQRGVRERVFCASMADVFEDRDDLNGERLRLWVLIEETPWLDWQLLTKRPQNISKILTQRWLDNPRPNVWMGTTVEDQQRADERIPHLLRAPAAVRFLSVEPLLGPLDVDQFLHPVTRHGYANDAPMSMDDHPERKWVIVGGESGPGARPCALEWIENVVGQCQAADVPAFVKQLGAMVVSEARTAAADCFSAPPGEKYRAPDGTFWAWRMGMDDRKGGDPAEWPEALRVREFPEAS